MKTYTEHQLQARVTDLEYALSQIQDLLTDLEGKAMENAKSQDDLHPSQHYAWAFGNMSANVMLAKATAHRALDLMA